MEFNLIRGQSTEIVLIRGRTQPSGALVVLPEVQDLSDAKEYCKYFENSLVEAACSWKTLVHPSKMSSHLTVFVTLDPNVSTDKPMGRISISQSCKNLAAGDANILERLVKVYGRENVRVNALVTGLDPEDGTTFKFEGRDLEIKLVEILSKNSFGVDFSIIPDDFTPIWTEELEWKRLNVDVTLSVVLNHKAVNELHLQSSGRTQLLETSKVLLTDAVYSDFVVIAANGAEVKCHRSFLAARSDVFKAMFESKMKEDASNSMEMGDMSEDGVRALLAYLYHWDLKAASESCEVAFELYRAAEKYNISYLESDIRALICAKPNEWFSVDMTVRLLLLARNVKKEDGDDGSKVLKKALHVMQWYAQNSPDKLRESEEYQQLYSTSPKTALEVGLLFLQANV